MHWGRAIASSESFQSDASTFTRSRYHTMELIHLLLPSNREGVKVGVVTDLGYITQLVAERLRGSNLVVIESNHDREMLKVAGYPWSVKQRIASNLGHLSNDETARWIRERV